MAVLSKIKSHSDAVDYFKELPFYNKPIKKPKVKRLKNIDRLAELPFYEQLSVIKTNQAFTGYAMSYKVEISERKNLIGQLEASKLSIKDLFSDFLNEIKGFKYQITVKVLLKKYKLNGEIEFAPVYFNSVTKTVINHRFRLENAFQEILYMIDNWINEGSGWIIELIESQYINISTYRPLSGSSYMDLPVELRSPRKGLINIKNKDQKCFYGVMLGILILQRNIQKELQKKIKILLSILLIQIKLHKKIKSLLVILIMMKLSFPCKKKILAKLKKRTIFASMCFVTKMDWFFRFLFQIKKLKIQ